MIREHKLCALVTARGGSKGIPRKNLYELAGVSLVERSVRLARRCAQVDQVLVSTEDPEITSLAVQLNAATPRPRPADLASDGARTIDTLRNLVEENVISRDDCILLLQPTTPLRTLANLDSACELLAANWEDADAVISVGAVDGPHPFKAQTIREGKLGPLISGQDSSVPRQYLPAAYLPNGALYLAKIGVLLKEDTFLPKRSLPLIMPSVASINLDGPLDLLLLEAVVGKGLADNALRDSGR
jgi:CMP-N,N'-diacetyllegionaminic acid synthase